MSQSQKPEVAVLFADISGSTRMYEDFGNTTAYAVVGQCLAMLQEKAQACGGRVVKTIGDAVMCVFPDIDAAIRAAAGMAQGAAALPAPSGRPVTLRIGAHVGAVIEEQGDVFGDAVNVAARMVEFAKAGQIVTTGDGVERLSPAVRAVARNIDTLQVKGRSNVVSVFEILLESGAADPPTRMVRSESAEVAAASELVLLQADREFLIPANCAPFTIGREVGCSLVVASTMVSRTHATIEWRRGKFVLVDSSTNGTFVAVEGLEDETFLKREDFVLRRRGVLGFGTSPLKNPGAAVRFRVR